MRESARPDGGGESVFPPPEQAAELRAREYGRLLALLVETVTSLSQRLDDLETHAATSVNSS